MDENPYKAPAGNDPVHLRRSHGWEPLDIVAAVLLAAVAGTLWFWLLP
jgi:hypothetical protein